MRGARDCFESFIGMTVFIVFVLDDDLRQLIRASVHDDTLTFVESAAAARQQVSRDAVLLVDTTLLSHDDFADLAGAALTLALVEDLPGGEAALRAGADDYLLKVQVASLLPRRLTQYTQPQNRQPNLNSQYILEQVGDGMLVVDDDGVIRFCNPAAARLLAQPADEIIGRVFGYPITTQGHTEIDLFRPNNGKPLVVELRAVEILWNGTKAHLATLRDITERIEAEQAVRLRDRAIQSSSSAIFIWSVGNPDWKLTFANPAFEEITGYRIGHVLGQPYGFLQAVHENIPPADELLDILEHDRECHVTTRSWHHSGDRYWSELRFSPIWDDLGQLSHIVVVQNDITQAKLLEQERLQKEKVQVALRKERELNQLKDRFLEMMAHELHTPLTSIMLSYDMLRQYGQRASEQERAEFLDSIREETERLNSIVNDVLYISRSNEGELDLNPETIDLVPFCQNLAKTYQKGYKNTHQFVFDSSERTVRTTADPDKLQRALSNVLENAVKYSPGGGTVHVSLSVDDETQYATIRVQDEGIGIPDEDQNRLFDPFHRGDNVGNLQGTGLGLTIVRQVLRAHEGDVTVNSQIGQGTMFALRLPIAGAL